MGPQAKCSLQRHCDPASCRLTLSLPTPSLRCKFRRHREPLDWLCRCVHHFCVTLQGEKVAEMPFCREPKCQHVQHWENQEWDVKTVCPFKSCVFSLTCSYAAPWLAAAWLPWPTSTVSLPLSILPFPYAVSHGGVDLAYSLHIVEGEISIHYTLIFGSYKYVDTNLQVLAISIQKALQHSPWGKKKELQPINLFNQWKQTACFSLLHNRVARSARTKKLNSIKLYLEAARYLIGASSGSALFVGAKWAYTNSTFMTGLDCMIYMLR